jgi:hypothetical protein
MVGWYRIIYDTTGWADNRNIIVNGIKPVVESLDDTSNLINFFFFQHNRPNDKCVKFTFYGNKEKVRDEFYQNLNINPSSIERWKPKKTAWRFNEDYQLGIKFMEISSRMALYSIDDGKPVETSSGTNQPITTIIRHMYLQNLGYGTIEEGYFSQFIDLPLYGLYNFLNIKIKP